MVSLSERLRAEGMQKGEVIALKRLIKVKFDELPVWAEERIQTASVEELEHWLDRVLTAESLEALLDGR